VPEVPVMELVYVIETGKNMPGDDLEIIRNALLMIF
jgi:hypothetical protein